MSDPYLLGIDIGTTGTKSVIFDTKGRIISRGYKEYSVITPKTGWVEQDSETWWDAVVESLKSAIHKASIRLGEILCVGLSGQTNSPLFVDKNRKPLQPCIIWMDRRADPQASWVRQNIGEENVHKITGVRVDSFYFYCKILWVKENQPKIIKQTQLILHPKDYIAFKLTGESVLDKAQASSGGLLNTKQGRYALDLLKEMTLPTEKLPELVSPTDIIGEITEEAAKITGLKKGTPVVAGTGDTIANAVGSGVVKPGRAYTKVGTASDVAVCVDHPVFDPKFRFVSYVHAVPDAWLLMGGASGGGICYRWFRDKFAQSEIETAKRLNKDPYEIMDEEASLAPPGSENLIFLPYFMGARSPIWDPNARGVFFGVDLKHEKKHFMRAIMEGIAYSVRHRIEIVEKELEAQIREVRIVGGGGKSRLWREIMTNVCNKPMVRLGTEEQECLGAAILAGVGIRLYKDIAQASDHVVSIIDETKPRKEPHKKYDKLYDIYVGLYDKLKDSFNMLVKS